MLRFGQTHQQTTASSVNGFCWKWQFLYSVLVFVGKVWTCFNSQKRQFLCTLSYSNNRHTFNLTIPNVSVIRSWDVSTILFFKSVLSYSAMLVIYLSITAGCIWPILFWMVDRYYCLLVPPPASMMCHNVLPHKV